MRDYVLAQQGAEEFIDAYAAALAPVLAGLPAGEQAALGRRDRLHRAASTAPSRSRGARASGSRELPGVAVRVKHRDLGRE